MKTMLTGLTGWMAMDRRCSESMKVVDTGLTVVVTLLVAVTIILLRS